MSHVAEALNSISIMAKGLEVPYLMVLQPYVHFKKTITKLEKTSDSIRSHLYRKSFMVDIFNKLDEKLKSTSFEGEVYYVNGSDAFVNSKETDFIDEVHLTKSGNRRFVSYLLKNAIRSGLYAN